MGRHSELFEHTADVGIRAVADSRAEVYEALAECLADQVCPRSSVEVREARALDVAAEDDEALAVDFLGGLLRLAQVDRFLAHAVRVEMRAEAPPALRARVEGEPYDPHRHELGPEIKAVTYHLLRVAREGDRWTAQVVLDL